MYKLLALIGSFLLGILSFLAVKNSGKKEGRNEERSDINKEYLGNVNEAKKVEGSVSSMSNDAVHDELYNKWNRDN